MFHLDHLIGKIRPAAGQSRLIVVYLPAGKLASPFVRPLFPAGKPPGGAFSLCLDFIKLIILLRGFLRRKIRFFAQKIACNFYRPAFTSPRNQKHPAPPQIAEKWGAGVRGLLAHYALAGSTGRTPAQRVSPARTGKNKIALSRPGKSGFLHGAAIQI
ncbi:hypothetical protein [Faecalibacterium sp. An122]|uniref:hypothetical protein n=1 Tax=Faecalibacterium sp. An122 TaxID=1965551 RepID=UPI00117A0AC1|nr:hypothetical protein [Faecalibacterium sp. An122]